MSWIKLPDVWLEDDDIERLGADAILLHLTALGYSSRHGTDGHVPTSALRRLWPAADVSAAVRALEEADQWEPNDDGWFLPHWRVHLLSKAEVEHRRQQSRETSERYRRHKAGDHSLCDRCAFIKRGDASGDVSRDTSVTPLVSLRLDSSRNEVRETRRASADDPATAAAAPAVRQDEHAYLSDGYGSCDTCSLPAAHPMHVLTGIPAAQEEKA